MPYESNFISLVPVSASQAQCILSLTFNLTVRGLLNFFGYYFFNNLYTDLSFLHMVFIIYREKFYISLYMLVNTEKYEQRAELALLVSHQTMELIL